MKVKIALVFEVKNFFQKHKKVLTADSAVMLVALFIFTAALISYYETIEKGQSPRINVFSQLPTSTSTPIDPKIMEFGLEIDKLNILVPIIKNVDGNNKSSYNKALQNGVAHYKNTALPGEKGNVFIFGHSSANVKGDYSETFASLNDLEENDEIIVYYESNEHKYKVKEKKIVEATDLSVLDKGKEENLTLMTCWPIRTKEKRLVVVAVPE